MALGGGVTRGNDVVRGKLIPLTILLYRVTEDRPVSLYPRRRTALVQACDPRIDVVQETA